MTEARHESPIVEEGEYICTICDGKFNIDKEGGIAGDMGILPVAFCPTCFTGVMDMADQVRIDWNEEPEDEQAAGYLDALERGDSEQL